MCADLKKKQIFWGEAFLVCISIFRFEAQADLAAKMIFQVQKCEIIYFMTILFFKIQEFGLKLQGKILPVQFNTPAK